MPATDLDWTELLLEQLTSHWDTHARPRLDGLTDDEYRWEPAPGSATSTPTSPDLIRPRSR